MSKRPHGRHPKACAQRQGLPAVPSREPRDQWKGTAATHSRPLLPLCHGSAHVLTSAPFSTQVAEEGSQKLKRTTVSLQHLTTSLQEAASSTRKYKDTSAPLFGRAKYKTDVAANLKQQGGAIKAYAISMLLEHGMKPTDFDRNKKAAALSYIS